jgi:hypothetical protein
MRTIIVLGILLIAFVVSGIFVQRYLAQTGAQMTEVTLSTVEAVRDKNWSEAKENAATLSRKWDKISQRWNLFTEHEEIDAINGTVMRLRAFVEEEDTAGSLSEGTAALQLFRHIPEKESITLTNIL